MSPKTKKILIFSGIGLDVAVTVFLFVVAIIMIATMPGNNLSQVEYNAKIAQNGPFIGYLQTHPTLYLLTCVVPLFVLLAANIAFLVLYVRKVGKKPEVAVDDLSEEQKAALRAELLKELQAESKEAEKEEKSE